LDPQQLRGEDPEQGRHRAHLRSAGDRIGFSDAPGGRRRGSRGLRGRGRAAPGEARQRRYFPRLRARAQDRPTRDGLRADPASARRRRERGLSRDLPWSDGLMEIEMQPSLFSFSNYRWIPWAIAGAFLIVAVVNGALAFFALRSDTGLVSEHPFELGNGYNRVLDAGAAQDALGWHGRVSFIRTAGLS